MASGPLYLGVDGGQSSTKAVVGDGAGAILARASAGPCNQVVPGIETQILSDTVAQLLSELRTRAGIAPNAPFNAVCYALSGGPSGNESLLQTMAGATEVEFTTDAHAALDGATAGHAGISVIAGTGSIALARDDMGRTVRCGGWGYVFGDEGGAFDIVRRAVREMLNAHEGEGKVTRLCDMLLEATGAVTPHDAMRRLYASDWPRSRIARLAVSVDRMATNGDPSALRVMNAAGDALADLALRARAALGAQASGLAVHPCGGVFASRAVRTVLKRRLAAAGAPVCEPRFDGATGALIRALRHSGRPIALRESQS